MVAFVGESVMLMVDGVDPEVVAMIGIERHGSGGATEIDDADRLVAVLDI